MCALYNRKSNGAGQHVDVSQWLSTVSMIRPTVGIHSHEMPDPLPTALLIRRQAGRQWVYPCKDGWVSFSPITDRFWRGAKTAMSNPEWTETELFATSSVAPGLTDAVEAALIDWLSPTRAEGVRESAGQSRALLPGAFAERSCRQPAI